MPPAPSPVASLLRPLLKLLSAPRQSSTSTGGSTSIPSGTSPLLSKPHKTSKSKSKQSALSPQDTFDEKGTGGVEGRIHMTDFQVEMARRRYQKWTRTFWFIMFVCVVDVGVLDWLWCKWARLA
ncbi:hypothetical protein HKX48_003523 [Thoreauomyces humboldtii]|nr:hypothetical protein HKX48_003523 [Thoreauomyces humboldtii]